MTDKQLIAFCRQLENHFPKLIRDRIPELIIKNEGRPARTEVPANKQKLTRLIQKKIVEESLELYSYKSTRSQIYGLADLIEIIEKFKKITNISAKQINDCRRFKNRDYGEFTKNYILISK